MTVRPVILSYLSILPDHNKLFQLKLKDKQDISQDRLQFFIKSKDKG